MSWPLARHGRSRNCSITTVAGVQPPVSSPLTDVSRAPRSEATSKTIESRERLRAGPGCSTVEGVTAAPLTEGDIDRSQAPDVRRLHAVAALTPHVPGSDPMWDEVVDWVSTHFDDGAAALFIAQLERARDRRAKGWLSDAHTMTSWALQETRAQMHRRHR